MLPPVQFKRRIFNEAFYPYLDNHSRIEIFYGGAGSGKSYFVAQRLVYRIMKEKGHKYLIVRKVARTNRHSTYDLICGFIALSGLNAYFKINKSDMEIICANGNKILFAGLDDTEKLKSITGITDIWVEEASEISQKDFEQLNLRLRGKTLVAKQITLTFNPVSEQSWLKSYFFDRVLKNILILKTTYLDNRFIDDEYKQVLEDLKETDYTFYQIYGLGNWGTPSNLIYHNYEVTGNMPASFDEIIYGIDFGFNNPSAIPKIGIKDQNIYVLDELYVTKHTNSELIQRLPEIINNPRDNQYADSQEPARITEIAQAGYNVYPSNKDVKDGIDYVKRQKIFIHPQCSNFLAEIKSYKYKEDRNGVVLEEPVKFKDHLMDAFRYALYTHHLKPAPNVYVL